MDHSVSLVQAYLQLNGYFTVARYPIIETASKYGYEITSDHNILAFRFPGAGCLVPGRSDCLVFKPDPILGMDAAKADMLVGEVEIGRASQSHTARSPNVLRAVLARFGCCPYETSASMVKQLLRKGCAVTQSGYRIRLMAFGSQLPNSAPSGCPVISLGHMVTFIEAYLQQNWSTLHGSQFERPSLGLFMVLENARREQEKSEEAL